MSSIAKDLRILELSRSPTHYKSLNWDRGKEMADNKRFTFTTEIGVYFCDPQTPWQHGSNENMNGPLREYLAKGINISDYSQAQLNRWSRL